MSKIQKQETFVRTENGVNLANEGASNFCRTLGDSDTVLPAEEVSEGTCNI